jgi:hypothetical protein
MESRRDEVNEKCKPLKKQITTVPPSRDNLYHDIWNKISF